MKRYACGVLGIALFALGCSGGERYGTLNAAAPAVEVKRLLLDTSYAGREVRLKGQIALQCASSGCWFFLDDGTGHVLVDLKGLGLGLQPRSGKTAEVSGTVVVDENGQAILAAKGLVIT